MVVVKKAPEFLLFASILSVLSAAGGSVGRGEGVAGGVSGYLMLESE